MKRPGLRVRTRTGFYGITDTDLRNIQPTRGEQLAEAVASPFFASDIDLHLTSLYSHDEKEGAQLRSLVHISAGNLTFQAEEDGWHKAVFDIVARAYAEDGTIVSQINRTHTMRVRDEAYERILKEGFVYALNVPLKKGGAYQMRAAVRDTASQKIGTAGRFVDVPEFKNRKLALSSVALTGRDSLARPVAEREDISGQLIQQALRKFRRGMMLGYSYHIYNVPSVRAGSSAIKARVRLLRDGKELFAGQLQPLDVVAKQIDKHHVASGWLHLGTDLPAGEYLLEVSVINTEAKKGGRITQLVDFEVTE